MFIVSHNENGLLTDKENKFLKKKRYANKSDYNTPFT